MIGSISNSAAQTGGTVLIKVASEAAQVFNTSKDQGASSSQGGESLKISTLAQQLSASASLAVPKCGTRYVLNRRKMSCCPTRPMRQFA